MTRRSWKQTAMAIALALVAVPATAQPSAPPPLVDPASIAALNGMSAYLRTLKTFQVEAATATDEVLEDGQLVKYSGTTNIVARFPDKLLADVYSDRNERQYLYDGKTFTLLARRVGYYATVPAPPRCANSRTCSRQVRHRGAALRSVPVGRSRLVHVDHYVGAGHGPGEVGGTTCEHYAFRQEGADWQIWIQKGDFPLPAQAGHHDDDRPGAAAAQRDLHLEPGAVGQRRGVRLHAADRRAQDRPRRRQQVEGART